MPTEDFTIEDRIRVLETRLAYLEKELTLILKEYNSKPPSRSAGTSSYQPNLPGIYTTV